MATDKIDVLDHGYVRLVDHMGTDLTAANAARVSYLKKSEEFSDKDKKLISFLASGGHSSPFRHAMLQFEIKAPIVVRSQWFKYVVGSEHSPAGFVERADEESGTGNGDEGGFGDNMRARNEASRRYVTLDMDYYVPLANQWRSKPANSKQGSGDVVSSELGDKYTTWLQKLTAETQNFFDSALADGICAEQARLGTLGYSLYAVWYWTASLQAVAHFLEQRLEHDAQKEIQLYAQAVLQLTKPLFPVSIKELLKDKITDHSLI